MDNIKYCKLCDTEDANQSNSHVVSKFLGIEILGDKQKRTGFSHTSKTVPRPVQDLPKEDFIYCENCEKKFGSVETIIASALKKNTTTQFNRNYDRIADDKIMPISISNREILIFVYINFFRLHNSKLRGLAEFKLEPSIYSRIKLTLNDCLATKLSTTKKLINECVFDFIPVTIVTPHPSADPTKSFFSAYITTEHKTGMIICGNWILYIYQNKSVKEDNRIKSYMYRIDEKNNFFQFVNTSDWISILRILTGNITNKYNFKT